MIYHLLPTLSSWLIWKTFAQEVPDKIVYNPKKWWRILKELPRHLASLAIEISIQFKPKKDNKRDLKIGDDFLLIVIMLTGIVKCLKFMMLAR